MFVVKSVIISYTIKCLMTENGVDRWVLLAELHKLLGIIHVRYEQHRRIVDTVRVHLERLKDNLRLMIMGKHRACLRVRGSRLVVIADERDRRNLGFRQSSVELEPEVLNLGVNDSVGVVLITHEENRRLVLRSDLDD